MHPASEIRIISVAEAIPLRHAVLRPGRPTETAHFPGDDAHSTRHFGAFRDGTLLAIASLYRVDMPEMAGVTAIQLRGMATAEKARGTGLGRTLLQACIVFARQTGVGLIWCNARASAVGFY